MAEDLLRRKATIRSLVLAGAASKILIASLDGYIRRIGTDL
jgi:hypothetical protein